VSHSYASCLYHCVWSTKQRQRIIIPELRERLWPYIGGIAKQNRMKLSLSAALKTTFMCSYHCPRTSAYRNRSNLLKAGRRSGYMIHFLSTVTSLGKKDTVHSASESHRLTTPSDTSSGKRNTTDNALIRMSSSPFWRNTTSNMIRGIFGTNDTSHQSSLTGLTDGNRAHVTQR